MAEEVSSPQGPDTPQGVGTGARRVLSPEESAQFRRRGGAINKRWSSPPVLSPTLEEPVPGIRRRSSTFSADALEEARKQFQSSADDILLPRPSTDDHDVHSQGSHWQSAPLAFALLPAIGGMLFQNGSSVVTDIMLLGLAAIFLNWSVRLPWDWYHSAQEIRKQEEYNGDTIVEEESEDEHHLDVSHASLEDVPEDEPVKSPERKRIRRLPAHERAASELYMHELLALLSCFLGPIFGAYLLHTIRGSLSRPSEGLVSNYNLTIFLLASELRPMSHLVKLVQARTLHLQRIVNSNPYNSTSGEVKELSRRLTELESKSSNPEPTNNNAAENVSGKQSVIISREVRQSLQPELDALNRAVRRYEKRATLQTMQTEARLLDLENRLADAIALAAAATQGRGQKGIGSILIEWAVTGLILPLQALAALATLPFKTFLALINAGRAAIGAKQEIQTPRKSASNRPPFHPRPGSDRLQAKGLKR